MKIFLLFCAICFLAIFNSCRDSNEPSIQSVCFPVKIGNYWVYDVMNKGAVKEEKDVIEEIKNVDINGTAKTAYVVKTYLNGEEEFYWYIIPEEEGFYFSSSEKHKPLVSSNSFGPKNVWLLLNFCSGSSFTYMNDSNTEKVGVVIGGKIEEAIVKYVYKLNGSLSGSENFNINNRTYNANIFNCSIESWEELTNPVDSTKLVRNQETNTFKIWYNSNIGFLKIENSDGVRTLKEYDIK